MVLLSVFTSNLETICYKRCSKSLLKNGSFENEALENEDRSTLKNGSFENEADSKTKTEARSTQNSKTKHPNLENEAP